MILILCILLTSIMQMTACILIVYLIISSRRPPNIPSDIPRASYGAIFSLGFNLAKRIYKSPHNHPRNPKNGRFISFCNARRPKPKMQGEWNL